MSPLSFDDYIYVTLISISKYKDSLKSSLPVCKVSVTKVPLAATEMYSWVIFDSVCMTVFLVDAAVWAMSVINAVRQLHVMTWGVLETTL